MWAELPISEHSQELLDQINLLAPFGQSNPAPLWKAQRLQVLHARVMGQQRQHLKLKVCGDRGETGEVLAWNEGGRIGEFKGCRTVDVLYTLGTNEWNGEWTFQTVAKAIRGRNVWGEFSIGSIGL